MDALESSLKHGNPWGRSRMKRTAWVEDLPVRSLEEDAESERLIQAAMDRLLTGRTVFVIAHRLSTVRGADRILVLDEGRLVESGTHEGLYAAGGLYRRLYEMQLEPGGA